MNCHLNDREVFKRIDGRWVSVGTYAVERAMELRNQLRSKGYKVKTVPVSNYQMSVKDIWR